MAEFLCRGRANGSWAVSRSVSGSQRMESCEDWIRTHVRRPRNRGDADSSGSMADSRPSEAITSRVQSWISRCRGAAFGQANVFAVYSAQLLIGGAAPFLGPTVAAMTLGIVGARAFDSSSGGTRRSIRREMCSRHF